MATTDFSSLTTSQKKLWSARVWAAGRDMTLLFGNEGFMGSGTADHTKPIHQITDLTMTERGAQVVMPIVLDLQGDGVVGDNELEGNEESLINDDVTIQIDQLRHAVKSQGKMSEQKTVIRFRAAAKDKLAFWLSDRLEELAFLTLAGMPYSQRYNGAARVAKSQLVNLKFASDVTAPSPNRVMYPNANTSTASLTTTDTLDWDTIVKAMTFASRKKIKPVRVAGKNRYVLIVSPEQMRDLKQSSDFKTILSRADARGPNNKLFTGAAAMVDNAILYESQKVPNTLGKPAGQKYGASGTVDGATALLLGAQALGFAKIGDADWVESDNQDYENRQGIGYGRMFGLKKPKFKAFYDNYSSEDFGVIVLYTAASQ